MVRPAQQRDGFALSDGVWPPACLAPAAQRQIACDCVLNSCFSIEHVDAIQRAADSVGVACTINPAGVDDTLAWQVGVHLAGATPSRKTGGPPCSGRQAAGSLAYRFIPAAADAAAEASGAGGWRWTRAGIREDLRLLKCGCAGRWAHRGAGAITARGSAAGVIRHAGDRAATVARGTAGGAKTERRLDQLDGLSRW